MKKSFISFRRLLPLALAFCLCLSLTGCKSWAASSADRQFARLDTAAPDGEAVEQAREAYEALSEEDRATLENYERLLDAEAQYHANHADALIAAVGEVTLESGGAIDAARAAYDALTKDERARVTRLDELTAAEETLHRLEVTKAAAGIDALIAAIGEVTLESGEAIDAARAAYDAADEEIRAAVGSLEELTAAEKEFRTLEVKQAAAEVDALIDSLGEITLESGPALEAARDAYESLDDEAKAEVGQLKALDQAEASFEYLGNKALAEEVDAVIAALDELSPESEEAVRAARQAYDALPPEARKLVSAADALEKAEHELQGLKDKAAAAEVRKLADAKKYTEAIEYAEDYMAGRDPGEVQGGVVKNCVNAYVQQANALMKKKQYQAAETLLQTCQEKYPNADLSAVKKAVTTLKKAIAEPKNGTVFASKAKGGYCTLTIKAGDTPVFVKVISNSDPKTTVTLYVRANKSATVHVKNGKYSLRYATGDKWYGSTELFGSGTRYYSADTTLSFTTSRSGNYINYQTYTITLYRVAGGNLSTSSISGDEF